MSELSDWKKHVHEPMVASMERQLKVMTETAAAYVNELKAERDAIEAATIERCKHAIRWCPSLDENGYICTKDNALKALIALAKSPVHKSDCPVNNGPALPVGKCDCGA